jgi:hypothetical protein
MTPDERIDRLVEALEAAGAPAPEAPSDHAGLVALQGEIAPLRLPDTLRRLWERVSIGSFALVTYPFLSTPEVALGGWRLNRDTDLLVPAGMLPFCYESHNHLLVELEGAGVPGGAVFEWRFTDTSLRLRCAHVDDWLDSLVTLLEDRLFERREGTAGDRLVVDVERHRALLAERLDARGPHPLYGALRVLATERDSWPDHWARATAPLLAAREARGASATVRELLAAARAAEARATLSGVRSNLSIGADRSWRVLLADSTGVLDVHCPVDTPGFHSLGDSPLVELDVRAPKLPPPRARVDWRALVVAPEDEAAAEPRLHQLVPAVTPQAVAEAIRPVRPPAGP